MRGQVAGAGPAFTATPMGARTAGKQVAALDERWLPAFTGVPLLMRVERQGEDTHMAVAFYALRQQADGGPDFAERARIEVPGSNALERVDAISLGQAGEALAIQTREDDPDEEHATLTVIGKDLALLFQDSFLRAPPPAGRLVSLADTPEGFLFHDLDGDGVPEIFVASEPKRLQVAGERGASWVEVGRRQRVFKLRGEKFVQAADRYVDFLGTAPLSARGHRRLVDGDATTSERLRPGETVLFRLPERRPLRLVRVIPGCTESEAAFRKGARVAAVTIALGAGAPMRLADGETSADPRLLGSGQFTLGTGWGSQELVFFDPPVETSSVALTVDTLSPAGASRGCLAEVSAH